MSVNDVDEDLSADAFDEADFPIPEEISISSPIEFPGDITPSLLASPEPPICSEQSSPQLNQTSNQDSIEQNHDHPKGLNSLDNLFDTESSHNLEDTSPLEQEPDEIDNSVESDEQRKNFGDNEEEEENEVPVTEVGNDFEDGFEHLMREEPRDGGEDEAEEEEVTGLEGDKESEEQKDIACWLCHRELTDFSCSLCPRSYHLSCMENGTAGGGQDWICPVCEKVSDAECVDSPTNLPEYITQETLCLMLKLAISHCRAKVNDLFHFPVSLEHFPTYPSFVINPMDLATLEQNCKDMKYFSTNAFVADVEWIYHNSCVFNSSQSPISKLAKRAVNHLRNEVEIIEVCPSCYAHHLMGSGGFSQLCQEAHEPVWAKVSGYPYWPAKVIREKAMQVEVQFFGDHDRAWVPKNKVLRMSKSLPETVKHNHKAFEISMEELKDYCENLQLVTNFKFSPHRTSFTGENKISRIEVKRTRRLSNFEYDFDETKTSVKSEPDSSESATESDVNLTEEAEKEVSIKEEPSDGLNNLDDTFQNLNTMTVPTSSSSSSAPDLQTSSGDITSSNSNSSAVSTPQVEADPDDVENFDMRFHFLSTLNSSTFLRSWSDTLEKDWVSENEESNRDETRCDVEKVVTAVQSRFAGKSGDSLAKLSRDLGSTSASSCTSRSANSWLAARQKSFPSMVPFSNPMATRTIPKLQCTQPKQPSPLLMQPPTSDAFSFTDAPLHKIPSASRLNMQVRQSIDPLSPMNAAMGPPPTMVNAVPTWPGPIQHLPFEQNPALNPPNMFNPLERMLPSSTFGPTPIGPTIIQQSPTPEMFMPTIIPLQNIQSVSTGNQIRKRLADDRFSTNSSENLSQPTVAMRPRLEVKGTPNMEAQTQGSLTEAKIVDKVTEKLSDSLQTMVESFLSSRGINNNNISSSSEPSAKVINNEEAAGLTTAQLESKISSLQDELAQVRRAKQEEVAELRGCYEYLLAEVRHNSEVTFKTELDKFKTKTTNEIKSRQWCAVCKKEAFYNCCWNTSYCSCECQKRHWATHANTCSHVPQQQSTQAVVSNSNGGESSSSASTSSMALTPHRQFLSQMSAIPSVTGPFPNLENAAKAVCSDSLHYQQPTVRFLNQQGQGHHRPMPLSSSVGGSGLQSNSNHIVKTQKPKLVSSGNYMSATPKIQSVMSLAANQNL